MDFDFDLPLWDLQNDSISQKHGTFFDKLKAVLIPCQRSTKVTEEGIYKLSEFYMMDFDLPF